MRYLDIEIYHQWYTSLKVAQEKIYVIFLKIKLQALKFKIEV